MKKSTLAIAFAVVIAGFLLVSCASAATPSSSKPSDNVVASSEETNASVTIASGSLLDPEPAAKIVTGPADQLGFDDPECSRVQSGKATVAFSWQPSGGGLQWLDISIFPNGFAPETFVGVGPFFPETNSFTWDGLMLGIIHYLRVNTLTANGWEPSETLVFGTVKCQDGVAIKGPTPDFVALQQRLTEAVESSGLTGTAVAVTDLQTGETISVNGTRPQLSGCVMNWFVLLQSVIDVQSGLVGEEQVGDLISRTIWGSNPETARDLYEIVGGGTTIAGVEKVSRLIAELGLSDTIIDHPPVYDQAEFPQYSRGVNQNNWITAEDANKALAKVYWGEVLTLTWRDYLLEKMEGVKPGLQYLLGSTPGGIVSHKNGFFASSGWIDNDIGIVRFDRGGVTYAYAISLFSQDVPSKYADISLGQEIAGLAWEYFSQNYP